MSRRFDIVINVKNYQNMVINCKDGDQYGRILSNLLKRYGEKDVEIATASSVKIDNSEYNELMKFLEKKEKEHLEKNSKKK